MTSPVRSPTPPPTNTDDRDDTAYDARLEQVGTTECRAAIKF
ncbi:hypothetical protein AB0O22_39525 [Streptomyces sp. NPDC091204]